MIEAIIGRFKTEDEARERRELVVLEDAGLAVTHAIRYDGRCEVWILTRKPLASEDARHLRLRMMVQYVKSAEQCCNAGAWKQAELRLDAVKRIIALVEDDVREERRNEDAPESVQEE